MSINRTILLIEDNPDDQELTRIALMKSNIVNDIVIIDDGAAALEYLLRIGVEDDRESVPYPTVVLLDLKLPKVDGTELLRALRANPRTQFIPVVVLTSSKEEQDIINSYRLGANSYIRKPVDFEQFTLAVAQLGLFWLLLNEHPYLRS